MSPPSWSSLPPSTPSQLSSFSQSTGFGIAASCSKFLLAIYFTYGGVCVSMLFSQIIPPSHSSTVFKSLFFMSVSPLLPCTQDCQYYLSRFSIYVLIYDIFLFLTYFTLYIGSRFIHLIRTDSNVFPFDGWVLFYSIYAPHLLCPLNCWWTSRLLPCLTYCKLCCDEHWGSCVLLNYVFFFQGICQVMGLLGHMVVLFLVFKKESLYCSPLWLYQFAFSPTV